MRASALPSSANTWAPSFLRNAASYILASVAVASAVWVVATTLWGVIITYASYPYWDGWSEVTTEQHIAHLFDQNNEHRIFVTRLFLIVDSTLFQANNTFALVSTLIVQGITAGLLVWLFRRSRPESWLETLACSALIVSMLFWFLQCENLAWGFNSQFVMIAAIAIASFAVFTQFPSWGGLLAATFLAALSVFAMANGILVPLLLVSLAIWSKRSWWQISFLVAASALLLAAFFTGYHLGPHAPANSTWSSMVADGAIYPFAFLGGPFELTVRTLDTYLDLGPQPAANIGICFGAIGFGLFGAAGLVLLHRGSSINPAQRELFHILAFAVGTAAMTAAGRIQFGIDQAFSSRYQTLTLIFWMTLGILLWSFPRQVTGVTRNIALASVALLTLIVAYTQTPIIAAARTNALDQQEGAAALISKVDVAPVLLRLFPSVDFLHGQAKVLRERRLSIYARPWTEWLGSRVTEHVTVSPQERCDGFLDEVAPVDARGNAAWSVRGWAWDRKARAVPEVIVLTGADGTVVGYGLPGYLRPDVVHVYPKMSGATGWKGFFFGADPDSVTAYALLREGKAVCPLHPSAALPERADSVDKRFGEGK